MKYRGSTRGAVISDNEVERSQIRKKDVLGPFSCGLANPEFGVLDDALAAAMMRFCCAVRCGVDLIAKDGVDEVEPGELSVRLHR